MIIYQFVHDIDEGGRYETARLLMRDSALAEGIRPDQLPPTLVAAMRAYLMGNVVEPVEWQIVDMSWEIVFGRGQGELELGLRRMAPSVVGPHDGNAWWSTYWARVQKAKVAVEMFKGILP